MQSRTAKGEFGEVVNQEEDEEEMWVKLHGLPQIGLFTVDFRLSFLC